MMLVLYILGIGLGMRFFAFGCSNEAAKENRIGCFEHRSNWHQMTSNKIQSDKMTWCYCIDHCKAKGYIYAGLKSGDTCLCGISYEGLSRRPHSCTVRCTGDSTKCCGGNKRIKIYSTETIFRDLSVSYKDIMKVLKTNPVGVEGTIYNEYTEGKWKHDPELGDVSAITLQIMSKESENTMFVTAVGYKEKENTTIFVPLKDNEDGDRIISYMISGILHAVAYDSNGAVQKASLAFSMNTSKPTSIDNGKEMCAFLTADNGKWSTDGCTTTVDGQLVNCSCNHTTSFAVLLQVKQTNISEIDAMLLSGISIGGLTLSSICLIATIIVILSFSQIRKSERGFLHLNLVVSLLAGQITFLLGIDKTENEKTCKFVAFLLHFTYLVVFAWMLLEAAYLYYKIISRAVTPVGIKVRYIGTALAWGTPVIIAGLTIAVAEESYIKTTSCWLNDEYGVVWAMIAPVIVILMINSIILGLVVRVMWQRARTHDAANPNFKRLKFSTRGALILFPLLGITWILGIFWILGLFSSDESVIMQYIFVCCNSLQGAFIFITFCIVDKEVRTLLVGFFRKYVMKSKVNTTDSIATSSSLNNKTQTKQRLHTLRFQPNKENET